MTASLRLALAASLLLALGACQMAQKTGFFVDVTDLPAEPNTFVDDIVVWPVQASGTVLTPELVERMTKALHQGMRDQDYSVISRPLVRNIVGQTGQGENAPLQALERTDADGVLVLKLTHWDERGLLNLGKVRAEGEVQLVGPGGRLRWQGRVRCDDTLVGRQVDTRDLEERRRIAVDQFAAMVASRLPRHRV
jgi:hypothetical protein